MNVQFYFDPSCPFCWITSRWLIEVSAHRSLVVDWRPFCLAIKNDEVTERSGEGEHAALHRSAHRVLRVMLAAHQRTGTSLIELYTAFGTAFHVEGRAYDDALIGQVLETMHLPTELLSAAGDEAYDEALQESIMEATSIVGSDIGVPTIVFENDRGGKSGFFGPVLQSLPDTDAGLELWDGLSKLAGSAHFYELKRGRPDGWPDVASTERTVSGS